MNKAHTTKLHEALHAFILKDFDHTFGQPEKKISPDEDWQRVKKTGSELWLDSGDIEEVDASWTSEFSALTTNNSLLNKEVQKGLYDDTVGEVQRVINDSGEVLSEREIVLEVAFALNAIHALKLVSKFDAQVSVELHTDVAHDIERTVEYGRRYYAICPERFVVKVPLTPAGYLAARLLGKEGIPINFTLGFGSRQNYVAARITNPGYVNVFMGRLNGFVKNNELGSGENVGEQTTRVTQRMVESLREAGQTSSKLIAASMRSGENVSTLAGVDVLTMPTKCAEQFKENPAAEVAAQVSDDLEIGFNAGVTLQDFAGHTLWEVDENLKGAVDALTEEQLDGMSGEDLQHHFAEHGAGDLLPSWTEEQQAQIKEDGKIPDYGRWKDALQSGQIGLDALMNISALFAFVSDQEELDQRIRDHLA